MENKNNKKNVAKKPTKKKTETLYGYIWLGRLNKPVAQKIKKVAADIYVDYNSLRHIARGRNFILEKLKMDPVTYVQKIVMNYTEIREGKNGALLLVAYIEENSKKNIAIVELQLVAKLSMYVVKTAMPRIKFAENEVVLWAKK